MAEIIPLNGCLAAGCVFMGADGPERVAGCFAAIEGDLGSAQLCTCAARCCQPLPRATQVAAAASSPPLLLFTPSLRPDAVALKVQTAEGSRRPRQPFSKSPFLPAETLLHERSTSIKPINRVHAAAAATTHGAQCPTGGRQEPS